MTALLLASMLALTNPADIYELSESVVLTEETAVEVTDYERSLLEQVAMNEAGNQGIQGIRYVVGTILNRVDSPDFPNTITEVIYQPYQFSTGNYWIPTEEVKQAVQMELEERSNSEILFFCSNGYNAYGTPAFKWNGHWFSTR